ncbi:MAG: VWA-like domain-containing protein [candidate division KSB1 bacterium]|nr:VWA-like domain-containing protein [candidate division KSB1 bacterium]
MVRRSPRAAVIVDTSGSMSEYDLGAALGAVKNIIESTGHAVDVFCADSEILTRVRTRSVREVKDVLKGGGGTDMATAIERVIKERNKPSVIVVLTDGITPWPIRKPSVPIIVGLIGDGEYPPPKWARVVRIKV